MLIWEAHTRDRRSHTWMRTYWYTFLHNHILERVAAASTPIWHNASLFLSNDHSLLEAFLNLSPASSIQFLTDPRIHGNALSLCVAYYVCLRRKDLPSCGYYFTIYISYYPIKITRESLRSGTPGHCSERSFSWRAGVRIQLYQSSCMSSELVASCAV